MFGQAPPNFNAIIKGGTVYDGTGAEPRHVDLLRLENGKEKWQVDLMKTAQREILARTRKAAPKRYAAAKDANSGNGSAYPEGFTVDVISDEDKITFPYHVLVDLTANPKDIDNFPAN